jgi:hypothetical protein
MSNDLSWLATAVDVIASLLCLLAMQAVVPRFGFLHTQRAAFGALAICLLWNGLGNPTDSAFGQHHLPGFCIDVSLLVFAAIYVVRGYRARKLAPHQNVEREKQPFDYVRELAHMLLDQVRNGR